MSKFTLSEEFFEQHFSAETRAKYTLDEMNELFYRLTVLTNLAFVLSDVVHSFFMDADSVFQKLDGSFTNEDKHNYNGLKKACSQGRMFAACLKQNIYNIEDAEDACRDADDYYYMIKLIEDRTGQYKSKFKMLLEFLLTMPEGEMFNVKYEDFSVLRDRHEDLGLLSRENINIR
jgi:hypothetical protein